VYVTVYIIFITLLKHINLKLRQFVTQLVFHHLSNLMDILNRQVFHDEKVKLLYTDVQNQQNIVFQILTVNDILSYFILLNHVKIFHD